MVNQPKRETKSSPFEWVTKTVSEREGIIDAIVALFDVVDNDLDMIEMSAFNTTVASNVSVLGKDGKTSIGKVLSLKVLRRAELPEKMRAEHPTVTGALSAKLQMHTHTAEGKAAFRQMGMSRVKEIRLHMLPAAEEYRHVQHKGKKTGVRVLTFVDLKAIQPVVPAPAQPKKAALTPTERARKLAELKKLKLELELMQLHSKLRRR